MVNKIQRIIYQGNFKFCQAPYLANDDKKLPICQLCHQDKIFGIIVGYDCYCIASVKCVRRRMGCTTLYPPKFYPPTLYPPTLYPPPPDTLPPCIDTVNIINLQEINGGVKCRTLQQFTPRSRTNFTATTFYPPSALASNEL